MKQPPGYDDGSGRVCRLIRALYGLKQAPRIWQEKLSAALIRMGFKASDMDPNLYVLVWNSHVLLLLDYVDDILLASRNQEVITWVKQQLMSQFKMTDLGDVNKYVGFEVIRDKEQGFMWLHQATYIKEMAEKYGLTGGKMPSSPLPSKFALEEKWEMEDEEPRAGTPRDPPLTAEQFKRFRKLVGSLNYAAQTTRLDVAFALNQLARAQHKPRLRHLEAAERTVRYLLGTQEWGIRFSVKEGTTLQCYVDASYTHGADKKSMTGFILMLGGGAVHWSAKKQDKVTTSTCDAESNAIQTAVQYVEAARDLLEELGAIQMEPTLLLNDNSAAVKLCVDAMSHKRSVQMTKAMAYVREKHTLGVINPRHVRTTEMAADFLTKNMAANQYEDLKTLAGMAQLPPVLETREPPPPH